MYRDPDHIRIAQITQHMIEQIVHSIYKVTNSIWWRCCFGNGGRIKTNLPLRTARFKSPIFPRLYFRYFEHLLLRHFSLPLCVLTARHLRLPLRLLRTEWRVRVQKALII